MDPQAAVAAAPQLAGPASSSAAGASPPAPSLSSSSSPSLFDANPFAKFLVLPGGDASALWQAEAEQLARMASTVGRRLRQPHSPHARL